MYFAPRMDFAAGLFVAVFGSGAIVLWGIPAILIEAVLLKHLLPQARAFRDSLVINLVSTLIGFLVAVPAQMLYLALGELFDLDFMYGDRAHFGLFWLVFAILTWGISVLIEGYIMGSELNPFIPKRELWRAILIVNAVSYAMPLVTLWLLVADW